MVCKKKQKTKHEKATKCGTQVYCGVKHKCDVVIHKSEINIQIIQDECFFRAISYGTLFACKINHVKGDGGHK